VGTVYWTAGLMIQKLRFIEMEIPTGTIVEFVSKVRLT
jgi:hypothetical protein